MRLLHNTLRKTGTLHHAYCIEGDIDASFSALAAFFKEALGTEMRGNPDVWRAVFETFGIDESRELIERQSRKAVLGGKKLFIVGAQSFTREAQNALLKVFEEPQGDTHFFVCVPSAEILLPTLRSRMTVLSGDSCVVGAEPEKRAVVKGLRMEAFLAAAAPERIAMLKALVENKDKPQAIAFLNALETALYAHADFTKEDAAYGAAFEEIMRVRGYLRDTAPSVKMLLEHIALSLPVAK